jgi:hypothetical protein
MSQFLTFVHRRSNSLPVRISGLVLVAFGIFMTIQADFWAIPIIFIGWVLFSSKKGVEIDKMQQEFRNYTSYLGYRVGSWHSLDKYPMVTLVRSRKRPKLKYASAYEEQNLAEYFDVCLLSKSHRGRVHLIIGMLAEEAKQEAIRISDELNREFVSFEPPKKKRNKYSLRDSRRRNPQPDED